MLGTNKLAVMLIWALTLVAAFAVGRSTAPTEDERTLAASSDRTPDELASAIEAALGEPDVLNRAEQTARLLQHLSPENVTEVAEIYDRMLNIIGELSIRPFIAAWARFDPTTAFSHTLGWKLKDKREMGAKAAIEAWALHDLEAARDAYARVTQRRPALEEVLFFDLLTGWLYSGQGNIDDFINALPAEHIDTAISRVAAKTLRSGGVDDLLQWVNSVTANDAYGIKFKKKAFQRGSRMVARWDPERAAAWVMENRGEAYALDGPRIVAEQWGERDGSAALAWVRNHPNEDIHHQAAREAFRVWFQSEPNAAAEWLKSEEITSFHYSILVFYTNELGHTAPEQAISWCERIVGPQRRLRCLEKAAAKWYQRDAVAAETWLQQSPLNEEARGEVRAPPKKRGARRESPEKRP
jgi:hypothetical protein